jgi:S1-C subfamily serine protease
MTKIATAGLVLILAGMTVRVSAQEKSPAVIQRVGKEGPGIRTTTATDLLPLPELAAIIAEDSGRIVVDHIMEPGMRPKGYEKTDLKEGDIILMANGGKLASVSALRDLYESAGIGSTVRIGARRGSEMLIASFVKADPKNLPRLKMSVSRGGGDDMFVLPQAGLLLAEKGKSVVVQDVIATPEGGAKSDAQKGDLVTALNGSPLHSLKDLRAIYSKIAVGDRVQLETSRAGKAGKLEFAKVKDEGKVTIRRQVGR